MTTPEELYRFAGFPAPLADGETAAFAPGEAATHRFGVEYRGPHETVADGTNRAVRLHARALASSRVPVLLGSISHTVVDEHGIARGIHDTGLPREVEEEVGELRRTSIATLAVRIVHLVVRNAEHLRRVLLPRSLGMLDLETASRLLRTSVVYSVWERDRVHPDIALLLNRVGGAWVPCEQNRQMLVESGVSADQVYVVPHPFDPDSVMAKLVRRPVGFRPRQGFEWSDRRYYSIGHWQPRKGFHELIGAFLLAHTPKDRASLTLKISGGAWDDYPTPEASINGWLSDKRIVARGWNGHTFDFHVRLIRERVPEDEIVRIHFENNLYVSASHGEAWNLGAFDAKVAGNRMIHVPFGGTADFANPETDVPVDWRHEPVHPSYHWEPGAEWAGYDVEALSRAMQAAEPGPFMRARWFEEMFDLVSVGARMRGLLRQIVRREMASIDEELFG